MPLAGAPGNLPAVPGAPDLESFPLGAARAQVHETYIVARRPAGAPRCAGPALNDP